MTERWKAVPGYEGFYEVSDLGRVRSLERTEPHGVHAGYTRTRHARILKANTGGEGRYPVVRLRSKTFTVHSLVLKAFVGPRPPGFCACHWPDTDKTNCNLSNLRWDTYSANNAERRMPPKKAAKNDF